jgi:hypothetical protein
LRGSPAAGHAATSASVCHRNWIAIPASPTQPSGDPVTVDDIDVMGVAVSPFRAGG